MTTYTFEVIRTHVVYVDVNAESEQEAIAKLTKEDIAQEEIESPNCVHQVVKLDGGIVSIEF